MCVRETVSVCVRERDSVDCVCEYVCERERLCVCEYGVCV